MKTVRLPCLGVGLLCAALLTPAMAADEDVLIRPRQGAGSSSRPEFPDLVLAEAMQRTERTYGPYRIEWVVGDNERGRMLADLRAGEAYNTTVMALQPAWDEKLLPIWIPVDMGLSNYRIGLTHRNAEGKIAAVRNLDQFRDLRVGVGVGWSSRKVLEADGFNAVLGENFETLLKLLMAGRIDYFPLAVSEVFAEYDERAAANPGLVVERDVVMEFPLPTYIFVSPAAPRLHRRLTEGMESMVADGTLLKMVTDYHASMIRRADFCHRRVFHIDNPFISGKTPLSRRELWFDPYDPKNGLCPAGGGSASSRSHPPGGTPVDPRQH